MNSGWVKGAVLGLAAVSLVVTGVGWQEPALAAGPLYDPTLLYGIDVDASMRARDCEPSLFAKQRCSLWGHWGPM